MEERINGVYARKAVKKTGSLDNLSRAERFVCERTTKQLERLRSLQQCVVVSKEESRCEEEAMVQQVTYIDVVGEYIVSSTIAIDCRLAAHNIKYS